jgi:hypothetical protein
MNASSGEFFVAILNKGAQVHISTSKFFYLFFLLVFTSGCSAYPIKKDVLLTNKISIDIPIKSNSNGDVPDKSMFISEATNNIDSYTLDSIGKSKAIELAEIFYKQSAEEYNTSVSNKNKSSSVINSAIRSALANDTSYITSYNSDRFKPEIYISSDINDEESGQGTVSVRSAAHWSYYSNPYHFNYHANSNIYLKLTYNKLKDIIHIDIDKIGYDLNCNFTTQTVRNLMGCGNSSIYSINEALLINRLRNITDNSDIIKFASPKSVRSKIIGELTKRYKKETGGSYKQEKLYKVDFRTAKARIQRAFHNIKFDESNSTFVFAQEYVNPLKTYEKVFHEYKISLFPDRNDTVVEFSGDYGYFTDTFGGKDLFGKSVYERAIGIDIKAIDNILNGVRLKSASNLNNYKQEQVNKPTAPQAGDSRVNGASLNADKPRKPSFQGCMNSCKELAVECFGRPSSSGAAHSVYSCQAERGLCEQKCHSIR